MKKILFLLLFLSSPCFSDYNGSLYDPKYGNLLYLRVYQPVNQICVQVNSDNHICWSTIVPGTCSLLLEDGTFLLLEGGGDLSLESCAAAVNTFLLLEDGTFFLLEDGSKMILQP